MRLSARAGAHLRPRSSISTRLSGERARSIAIGVPRLIVRRRRSVQVQSQSAFIVERSERRRGRTRKFGEEGQVDGARRLEVQTQRAQAAEGQAEVRDGGGSTAAHEVDVVGVLVRLDGRRRDREDDVTAAQRHGDAVQRAARFCDLVERLVALGRVAVVVVEQRRGCEVDDVVEELRREAEEACARVGDGGAHDVTWGALGRTGWAQEQSRGRAAARE